MFELTWPDADYCVDAGLLAKMHVKGQSPRERFKFAGRGRHDGSDYYIWERPLPGDSRAEQIMCGVDWFWNSQPSRKEAD